MTILADYAKKHDQYDTVNEFCFLLVNSQMTSQEMFRSIASLVQLFKDVEQKEKFLFVLGALFSRVISLKKASEIMEIEPWLINVKISTPITRH